MASVNRRLCELTKIKKRSGGVGPCFVQIANGEEHLSPRTLDEKYPSSLVVLLLPSVYP